MANHCFVTTKKPMKSDQIQALVEELNSKFLHNNLQIERDDSFWRVKYVSGGEIYGYRSFWLKTSRTFEMRHCPGGDFMWWIGWLLVNEIAVQFDGSITDEGVDGKWKGVKGKYNDFRKFLDRMKSNVKNLKLRDQFIQLELESSPPEFSK